jgi:lipopolysaccharide/colanic/teichoic acid biosynthesis glycosyltransferase
MNSIVAVRASPMRRVRPRVSWSAAFVRRAALHARLWLLDLGPLARRLLDIVVSAFGLLAVAPILTLAAIAIKLTSRGPVLFRQERVGQYGRRFVMLKLRTMYTGAEVSRARLISDNGESIRFKMRADPRITPVGRILRRYSVDELPQLWNVLVGDMTLVGPRPALGVEVARYDAYALRRLEVRQGLTCLWQVSGRSELSFEKQVELDIAYIDRTAAASDLELLVRTIPAVLTGRGAY